MKKTIKVMAIAAALAVLNGIAFADEKGNEIMNKVAVLKKPAYSVTDVT